MHAPAKAPGAVFGRWLPEPRIRQQYQLEIEGLSRAEFLQLRDGLGDGVRESPPKGDNSVYHELGAIEVIMYLTPAALMLLMKVLSGNRSQRKLRVRHRRKDADGPVEEFELDLQEDQSQSGTDEALTLLADHIRHQSGLPKDS